MKKRWWRRNIWGLLLIPPLAAGLLAFEAGNLYHANYRAETKEPVPVDITGRAVLDVYAFRLIQVRPLETDKEIELVTRFGRAKPPPSVKVWQAMVSVEAPAESLANICDTALEDAQGRRYDSGPSELGGDSSSFQGCSADDEKQPAPWTATFYYLLPNDARPTKLIITWMSLLPRFVELDIP